MALFTLADGRALSYHAHGDARGAPVLYLHGVADAGCLRHYDDALTASLGVHLIGVDLPGIGLSSPKRGRGLLDWTRDAVALADHLGLERFCVAGHSGGAPHAMALAMILPQRVSHLVLVAPTTYGDDPGAMEFIASDELRAMLRLLRWNLYPIARLILRYISRKATKNIAEFVHDSAFTYPRDIETFLGNPDQRAIFEKSFLDGMAQGGEGMYEIFAAIMRPWGFKSEDIQQPVTIFCGEADEVISSEMSTRLANRMRYCTLVMWKDGGHYEFVKRERWMEFLAAVKG